MAKIDAQNNTGVFCSTDPDTLNTHKEALAAVGFQTLCDLDKIEDPALKLDILDNSIFCTNLEPAEARTFMPCLDEPSFKAKFKLTVNLSNS